jgi:hypothetical protein
MNDRFADLERVVLASQRAHQRLGDRLIWSF